MPFPPQTPDQHFKKIAIKKTPEWLKKTKKHRSSESDQTSVRLQERFLQLIL